MRGQRRGQVSAPAEDRAELVASAVDRALLRYDRERGEVVCARSIT